MILATQRLGSLEDRESRAAHVGEPLDEGVEIVMRPGERLALIVARLVQMPGDPALGAGEALACPGRTLDTTAGARLMLLHGS